MPSIESPFAETLNRLVTNDGVHLSKRAYVILVLLCLAFFLPGLTSLPPVDRDEPLYAQATKQMIETGNYTDIHFQQETRYKKPIGIYWLQSASVKLFSPHKLNEIWAYRLPSLAGMTIAIVMTAALGALLFGPMTGFLAALLLAGCVLLNAEARLAKTDAALMACVMIAQYTLAYAYRARQQSQKVGWPLFFAFWTSQAFGFLLKGPILGIVTGLALIALRLMDKRLDWFRALRPILGIAFALLLVLPWFVVISLSSHGQFIAEAAGHDLLAKIWQGQLRGIMPPGLHFFVFPIAFYPASLLTMGALPDVWRQRHEPFVRFLLCWIIPIWILFEVSLTKLPHYVMPAYPAIAILTAKVFLDGFPFLKKRRSLKIAIIWVWCLIGLIGVMGTLILPYYFNAGITLISLMAVVAILYLLIVGIGIFDKPNFESLIKIAGASLIYMALVFGTVFPSLSKVWLAQQVVDVANTFKPCGELNIVSAAYNEPSLAFLAGTHTRFLFDGDVAAKMIMENRCLLALIDWKHEKAFLDTFKNPAIQPLKVTSLEGPNIGSGRHIELSLYRMPKTDNAP